MTTGTTVTTPTVPATYASAYAALAAIAERLRSAGTAATIDTLAEDVRAARHHYDVCRGRLAAIRAEIDAEVDTAAGAGTAG